MFETLINGSVKEICEPMIDGVPYNSGLNRGAKLKAVEGQTTLKIEVEKKPADEGFKLEFEEAAA